MIEILVVISIIGLMLSVAMYLLTSSRENARIAKNLLFSDGVKAKLSDAPIAYWSFNNSSANDFWGNNNGTLIGNPIFVTGVNNTGNALDFSGGTGKRVEIPYSNNLNVTEISVEAWVKVIPNDENDYIFVSRWSSGGYVFLLRRYIERFEFLVNSVSGNCGPLPIACFAFTPSSKDYRDGKWHHIVGVMDNNKVLIYVDTVKYSTASSPPFGILSATATNSIRIGAYSPVASFPGQVDEVRIYGEALTAQEVQKHYAEGASKHMLAIN